MQVVDLLTLEFSKIRIYFSYSVLLFTCLFVLFTCFHYSLEAFVSALGRQRAIHRGATVQCPHGTKVFLFL